MFVSHAPSPFRHLMATGPLAILTLAVLLPMVGCAIGGGMSRGDTGRFALGPGQYTPFLTGMPATPNAAELDSSTVGEEPARSALVEMEIVDAAYIHRALIHQAAAVGGYVVQSAPGQTTIRIPPRRFGAALAQVLGLGSVTRMNLSPPGVGIDCGDVETQLDNLERARQRYLELLAAASDLARIQSLEAELKRLGAELGELRHQQRYQQGECRMSTITVQTTAMLHSGPVGGVFTSLFRGLRWLFGGY